jgi:hypothetical protein
LNPVLQEKSVRVATFSLFEQGRVSPAGSTVAVSVWAPLGSDPVHDRERQAPGAKELELVRLHTEAAAEVSTSTGMPESTPPAPRLHTWRPRSAPP